MLSSYCFTTNILIVQEPLSLLLFLFSYIIKNKCIDFKRIFFTILCFLIKFIYTKLIVYNLDVFNLFNIYKNKSARECSKCKSYLLGVQK